MQNLLPISLPIIRFSWLTTIETIHAARSTYDVADAPVEENIATLQGFLRLLQKTLRIKAGGLLYAGHPCSSMVWVSKKVHKRDASCPWGDFAGQPSFYAALFMIRHVCWDKVLRQMMLKPRCAGCKYDLQPLLRSLIYQSGAACIFCHRAAHLKRSETQPAHDFLEEALGVLPKFWKLVPYELAPSLARQCCYKS